MSKQDQKLQEGKQHIANAQKHLKTSVFKWNPDVDGACREYEKAAICFKNAKAPQETKEAYVKAAELKYQQDLLHQAGTLLENAAQVAKEQSNFTESAALLQQAASYYQENQAVSKAAETLTKGAKLVEEENPDKAIEMYHRAIALYEADERESSASPTYRSLVSVLARSQRHSELIELLNKMVSSAPSTPSGQGDICKYGLSLIVVHLKMGDLVSAERAFQELATKGDFFVSDEGQIANDIVDGFKNFDRSALQRGLSNHALNYLDPQILRIAKTLSISSAAEPLSTSKPTSSQITSTSTSSVSSFTTPSVSSPAALTQPATLEDEETHSTSTQQSEPPQTTTSPVREEIDLT